MSKSTAFPNMAANLEFLKNTYQTATLPDAATAAKAAMRPGEGKAVEVKATQTFTQEKFESAIIDHLNMVKKQISNESDKDDWEFKAGDIGLRHSRWAPKKKEA